MAKKTEVKQEEFKDEEIVQDEDGLVTFKLYLHHNQTANLKAIFPLLNTQKYLLESAPTHHR